MRDIETGYNYTRRSTIIFLISATRGVEGIARQGLKKKIAGTQTRRSTIIFLISAARGVEGIARQGSNKKIARRLNPSLDHHLLDFGNRFGRV